MHSFIYISTSPRLTSQPPLLATLSLPYIPFLILHLFAWRIIYTYNEMRLPIYISKPGFSHQLQTCISCSLLDTSPWILYKPKLKWSKMELSICEAKWNHRIFHMLLLAPISLPVPFTGLKAVNMCLFLSAWHSAWHLVGIYQYLWKK